MKRIMKFSELFRLSALLVALLLVCAGLSLTASALSSFNAYRTLGMDDQEFFIEGSWTSSLRGEENAPKAVFTVGKYFDKVIHLRDATVDLSKQDYLGLFYVEPGAKLTIHLFGANTILAGSGCAGISVPVGAKLTILGNGTLTVTGGDGGAGIGGDRGVSAGEITIGDRDVYELIQTRITASGGTDAAGIGGGAGGDADTVTIWSGLIAANGNGGAQDIGAGAGGKPDYTRFRGGRLVSYDNIGWTPADSAVRQEVRVTVDSLEYVGQVSLHPFVPNPEAVLTTDVPRPGRGYEEGVAYLYLPSNLTGVKLHASAVNENNVDHRWNSEGYREIPPNHELRIDVLERE